MKCPFCNNDNVVAESQHAYVRKDAYPVTPGHKLVIPKRHVSRIWDLSNAELADIWQQIAKIKAESPFTDFNIGLNDGVGAGQTISHVHVHVIPRTIGDMKDPKGGVRGVIPEKQKY